MTALIKEEKGERNAKQGRGRDQGRREERKTREERQSEVRNKMALEGIGQDMMGWDDRERRGVTGQDGMGQDGMGQWEEVRRHMVRRDRKVVLKYDDRCKKGD